MILSKLFNSDAQLIIDVLTYILSVRNDQKFK